LSITGAQNTFAFFFSSSKHRFPVRTVAAGGERKTLVSTGSGADHARIIAVDRFTTKPVDARNVFGVKEKKVFRYIILYALDYEIEKTNRSRLFHSVHDWKFK